MNKIKSHIESLSKSPHEEVIDLSESILDRIGMTISEIPPGFNYPIGGYRIVKTQRRFGVLGLVDLLEINPISAHRVMGTTGALNAGWIIPAGDKTVNLPPPHVIAEFWDELTKHLAE